MEKNLASTTLTVALGERAYPIRIGAGQRASVLQRLRECAMERRPVLVATCPPVAECLADFLREAEAAGARIYQTTCDGEPAKSAAELSRLWEALAAARVDRTGMVVALGGGVVGDLAGFAAASFLRGVDFVQVPTTLLAMVDSSVGGKTGINLAAGKNLAGAFYQPQAVFVDTDMLATLPPREFAAGMAEVIKYGLLGDAALFARLECGGKFDWQHSELTGIIERCCAIKAEIVKADERETAREGGRALLNLGHTFGHAIEKVAGYGVYLHGEAVAIGLVLAARLSAALGLLPPEAEEKIVAVLRTNVLPVALREPLSAEALLAAMRLDKKVRQGALRFVVLTAIGQSATREVDDVDLLRRLWVGVGAE